MAGKGGSVRASDCIDDDSENGVSKDESVRGNKAIGKALKAERTALMVEPKGMKINIAKLSDAVEAAEGVIDAPD